MKIYVSSRLEEVGNELKKRGYDVISEENNNVDAIICNLKDGDLNKININSNIKLSKTVIIDCGSKKIDDIEYILNNRICSSVIN